MHLAIALLLALVSAAPALAADRTSLSVSSVPIGIFLQSEANDRLGELCAERLREALDRSKVFHAVDTPASAQFVVGLLTMDPREAEAAAGTTAGGESTVAAVTLQRENSPNLNELVYSWVLVARRDNIDALIAQLVTAIDREIRELPGQASGPAGSVSSK